MEIIEFLKTKLMHILNRESFHPPKINQNLAVIHYRNFFWKLQVNFRDIYILWFKFFLGLKFFKPV